MKPPNAAKCQGVTPPRPLLLKIAQQFRWRSAIPIVNDIQQMAAIWASNVDFVDREFMTARCRNAALKSDVGNGCGANVPSPPNGAKFRDSYKNSELKFSLRQRFPAIKVG